MGLIEGLFGRRQQRQPKLDALFAVPSAAITLEAATGFRPTGTGSVCFRAGGGAARAQLEAELRAMLDDDPEVPDDVELLDDSYGYTWLVVRRELAGDDEVGSDRSGDVAGLCTELHAVNSTLEAHGFATGLLCTVVPFADPTGRRVGLVYLYKQGTWYPFAPRPGDTQARDNLVELQVRDLLGQDLPMERDLQRWMALWGAPGL